MSIEQCKAVVELDKKGYKAVYESCEWGFIALTTDQAFWDNSRPRNIDDMLAASEVLVERNGKVIWKKPPKTTNKKGTYKAGNN